MNGLLLPGCGPLTTRINMCGPGHRQVWAADIMYKLLASSLQSKPWSSVAIQGECELSTKRIITDLVRTQ